MKILFAFLSILAIAACATQPSPSVENPQLYDTHGSTTLNNPDAPLAMMSVGSSAIFDAASDKKGKKVRSHMIQGHCVILSGESESPCSSMLILLKGSDGEILQQERTDVKGDFTFLISQGDGYQIGVKSMRFKVGFEPEPPFRTDSHVLLKLQPL